MTALHGSISTMRRVLWLAPIAGILLWASVTAAAPPAADTPPMVGLYAFDWLRVERSKCQQVKGRLLAALLKRYTCKADTGEGSSGKRLVARCTAKRGRSEFLAFGSAAACNDERDTQLSHAE